VLLRFIISNVFSFYTSTYFLWHAVTIVITSWPALRFFVFVRHTTHCFFLLVFYMFCGWKHCPEEAHLNRWAKHWLIVKYNHLVYLIHLFVWFETWLQDEPFAFCWRTGVAYVDLLNRVFSTHLISFMLRATKQERKSALKLLRHCVS